MPTAWDNLDMHVQDEVVALARAGSIYADLSVCCAAWDWANSFRSPARYIGRAGIVLSIAIDLATGVYTGGGSGGPTIRQSWRENRAARVIYRTYRKTEVPVNCRKMHRNAQVSVEDLRRRYKGEL